MTKEEMVDAYMLSRFKLLGEDENYVEAQKRIKSAMEMGLYHIALPGKSKRSERDFPWSATKETIEHLKRDGFDVDKVDKSQDYWDIEWY